MLFGEYDGGYGRSRNALLSVKGRNARLCIASQGRFAEGAFLKDPAFLHHIPTVGSNDPAVVCERRRAPPLLFAIVAAVNVNVLRLA